jgi:hypothetical protein
MVARHGGAVRSLQWLAVDSSGNLYIADVGNNRVRKVNTAGIITTVVGTGLKGFSADGGLAKAVTLDIPQGISVNSSGKLYIVDWQSHPDDRRNGDHHYHCRHWGRCILGRRWTSDRGGVERSSWHRR